MRLIDFETNGRFIRRVDDNGQDLCVIFNFKQTKNVDLQNKGMCWYVSVQARYQVEVS